MTLENTLTNCEIYIREMEKKDKEKYFSQNSRIDSHPSHFIIEISGKEYPITIKATEPIYENDERSGFEFIEEDESKKTLCYSSPFTIHKIIYHNKTKPSKEIDEIIKSKVYEGFNQIKTF